MALDIEARLEAGLFRSRWLLAAFYIGLVLSILALVWAFLRESLSIFEDIASLDSEQVIVEILSLIDLSLAANLTLIVIFSGYENFVSKIDTGDNEDRPSWMGTLDFSGLKMKLIGSIVAISAISLLKSFIQVSGSPSVDFRRIYLLIALHMTFVVSGVLFALMDFLSSQPRSR